FNTYGPRMRMRDGRVVPSFITQALRGEGLTVYGKGTQTRSFLYVDDLVRGLLKLIEADYHLPVNIGSPHEMTVLDFAKKILALTGSKSSIVYQALPEDDPQVRQPDISKARELLAWQPQVSLDKGLGETVEYFKKQLKDQPI
ncbi:MAG: GDP-mannose 4,6-dehydratase, partial [Deltaproteobacteria bacterium]|nr:GDP-mannose 4,6-dehydratase [Deltaproteobacteria bacterium]